MLNGREIFSKFSQQNQWLEITKHHQGDINTLQAVLVTAGANVTGNIIAPQLLIAGVVHGTAVSMDTTINEKGQVWGDIYTNQLNIKPSGEITGRIYSLTQDDYQKIQNTSAIHDIRHVSDSQQAQKIGAGNNSMAGKKESHYLTRLGESSASARVDNLAEELQRARAESAELKRQLTTVADDLHLKKVQIEKQTAEYEAAQARNKILDLLLHQEKLAADELHGRIRNLEAAMQDSLNHAGEQDQKRQYWQDVTYEQEVEIDKLEIELHTCHRLLEEAENLIDTLQNQRHGLATELEHMLNELDEMSVARKNLETQVGTIPALQENLVSTEQTVRALQGQLLWQNANMEMNQVELENTRHQLVEQEAAFAALEISAARQRVERQHWQTQAMELRVVLQAREDAWKEVSVELSETRQQAAAKQKTLQEELRRSQAVNRADLERYIDELIQQGERLAESRSMLVERELALGEAQEKSAKQAQMIGQMRSLADGRIKHLQNRLNQVQAQVNATISIDAHQPDQLHNGHTLTNTTAVPNLIS